MEKNCSFNPNFDCNFFHEFEVNALILSFYRYSDFSHSQLIIIYEKVKNTLIYLRNEIGLIYVNYEFEFQVIIISH